MTRETKAGLGTALNEAALLGVEVRRDPPRAAVTLSVLTLPADGGAPAADRRVSLALSPVGRIVASLRHARWDDDAAPAVPFALEDLLPTVRSFQGLPIYGWEFIDTESGYERWSRRLSLDEWFGPEGHRHSITLFQDGVNRILDVRIWFDELRVLRPDYTEIPIDEFIAGGERWWNGLHKEDPRTEGEGIFPAGEDSDE